MVLIGSIPLSRQRISMHIRDHHMGIDRELGLRGGC